MEKTVAGLFDSRAAAGKAITGLDGAGFSRDRISVVAGGDRTARTARENQR